MFGIQNIFRMHSLFFLTFILACGTYVAATLDMANTAALPRHDFLPSRPEQYLSINTNPIYDLIDTYDATNFWDKFNFMEVRLCFSCILM